MIRWENGFNSQLLTEEDIRAIDRASVDILVNSGVIFDSPEALAIFQDHGAAVDWSSRRVRLTEPIIEKALKTAPSSFVLKGRDPRCDYLMGENQSGFTTFGVGFSVVDRITGELRDSTKKDLIESVILSDYLENIDIYSHALAARDCPLRSVDLHEAEAFLTNTVKHCMHLDLGERRNIRRFIEMAGAVTDGVLDLYKNPVVSALTCPLSPLRFSANSCDLIIEFARVGLPVNILPMAIASQTAPVTIAGTIVVSNSEFLAGLALSQLTSAGVPVIYGCSDTTFDYADNVTPVGSPELGLCSAAAAAMARFYQIPSYVAGT
ncbi:MAG: trimethylamine methyltransferase family protein [Bacillota bacterium]|jgi:trimethylamine--corrinoid protein Co-methyltransferase